ncbi:hypothetical protein LR48_Vigan04g155900 [Vigna angularis]|uniref:Uncharacterized protein n=1 Tax=Phaseolus angularis TaxID=3914 RepID=A0A0L9UF64_PHAAN|nr:hypothetical protein LR48_Vigan04g155900 [Vigna angularis]
MTLESCTWLARLNGQVSLFVVHTVSEHEVIHLLEYVLNNTPKVEVEGVLPECGQSVHIGDGQCEHKSEIQFEVPNIEGQRGECDGADKGQIETQVEVVACEGDIGDTQFRGDYERTSIVEEEFDVGSWSSSGDDGNVDVNI